MTLPIGYLRIAGDWSYAPLRHGLIVRAPDGTERYCQPGDDEAAIRDIIAALDEIESGEKRAGVCAVALGDYF